LNTGGEREFVQAHLTQWLNAHESDLEASFVYNAWLDTGGEREFVQAHLTQWLNAHESDLEARFIYKAWLDAGGEKEFIQTHLPQWLHANQSALEAQFVYNAWLVAGGDQKLIQAHLTQWLNAHESDLEARFIYKVWLDAGGGKEFVQVHLTQWLHTNKAYPEGDFICKSWLEAGGDFSIVKDFAIDWFQHNWSQEGSVYLSKFLAKQDGIPINTVKNILDWCCKFPTNEDAIWRFIQLNSNLFLEGIESEVYSAATAMLSPLIERVDINEYTQHQIHRLFSCLLSVRSLYAEPFEDSIDILFLSWFKNPIAFGSKTNPKKEIQRFSYFQRFVNLITSKKLGVETDRELIINFLKWINHWEDPRKNKIRKSFNYLKKIYPESDLWEIVQFEIIPD
jgi:hypothetical protein